MITKVIKNTSSTIEIPIFFLLRVQAERNKRYFKLLRRNLSYAKRVQAERNKRHFKLLRRSLSYAKIHNFTVESYALKDFFVILHTNKS